MRSEAESRTEGREGMRSEAESRTEGREGMGISDIRYPISDFRFLTNDVRCKLVVAQQLAYRIPITGYCFLYSCQCKEYSVEGDGKNKVEVSCLVGVHFQESVFN